MARYKVEYETESMTEDDGTTIRRWLADRQGVWVVEGTVKVERLPDPDIVEEFTIRLRVTSPTDYSPVSQNELAGLHGPEVAKEIADCFSPRRKVEVIK